MTSRRSKTSREGASLQISADQAEPRRHHFGFLLQQPHRKRGELLVRSTEEPLSIRTAHGNIRRIQDFGNIFVRSKFNKVLNLRETVLCNNIPCSFVSASRLNRESNMHVVTGGRGVRIVYQEMLIMDGSLLENGRYKLSCTVEIRFRTLHVCYISRPSRRCGSNMRHSAI